MALTNNEIQETVEDLKPAFRQNGFRLVEFTYDVNSCTFRFLVDKTGKKDVKDGITHGDCIFVTKIIESEFSRRSNFETVDYSIEVSSPGVSRPFSNIEDYEANIGFEIVVKLKTKIDGHNTYVGYLRGVDAAGMSIDLEVTAYDYNFMPKKAGAKKAEKITQPAVRLPISEISKAAVKIQF